jgi:hypothetical protein
MWQVWGRGEVRIRYWWGKLSEGVYLEDPGINGKIILIWILQKWNLGGWDIEWINLAENRSGYGLL